MTLVFKHNVNNKDSILVITAIIISSYVFMTKNYRELKFVQREKFNTKITYPIPAGFCGMVGTGSGV